MVSVKKLKLSSLDTKTQKKSKSRCIKNTKDNFLQDINDTNPPNAANETLDNSSGSEYVPSGDEIESGNVDVYQYTYCNKLKRYINPPTEG